MPPRKRPLAASHAGSAKRPVEISRPPARPPRSKAQQKRSKAVRLGRPPTALPLQTLRTLVMERVPWLTLGLSPLQRAAVAAGTEAQHFDMMRLFCLWLLATSRKVLEVPGLDLALVDYFQALMDEKTPPHVGSKTLASFLHAAPNLGSSLRTAFPLAHRALVGWQRLMPAQTRPPVPFLVVVLIVLHLLSEEQIAMALCILLMFTSYLRPREATSLRREQLVPPQIYGGAHFQLWALVLHPLENMQASKCGQFDESILIDSEVFTGVSAGNTTGSGTRAGSSGWISPFLECLRADGSSKALWPFEHVDLIRAVHRATECLGLTHLKVCLYSMRHGGASHDWLISSRSLSEIKSRGRWSSDSSLRRYQKAAKAQSQLSLVGAPLLEVASRAAKQLGDLFHQPAIAQVLYQQARAAHVRS